MKTYKYMSVFEGLQRDILGGKFARGKRLPSETELCFRYKVSRPTAARALRELQQMGVIIRRAGAGNYLASEPATQPTTAHTLGLFVPGLGNTEILDPICNEITRFAQTLGCAVLWGDATAPIATGADALHLCKRFISRKVDGVFFAPLESIPERSTWNRRIADEFCQHEIPFILLDRDLGEFPSRSEFDLIGIDNVAASIAISTHLLEQGRSRLCFVARDHFPSTTDLRLLGCREAIRRFGIKTRYQVPFFGDPSDPKFVSNLLTASEPDAILCANDQSAALLMRTLVNLKRAIPDEIAVAGFDDVQYATLLTPSLTTISQPCRELARSAVKALLERIQKPDLAPRQILHSHTLVARQSTIVTQPLPVQA
jgi:DNA-binding LacI/PurR family transcriptional regulator